MIRQKRYQNFAGIYAHKIGAAFFPFALAQSGHTVEHWLNSFTSRASATGVSCHRRLEHISWTTWNFIFSWFSISTVRTWLLHSCLGFDYLKSSIRMYKQSLPLKQAGSFCLDKWPEICALNSANATLFSTVIGDTVPSIFLLLTGCM
jgi:hypothetical protein